MESSLKQKGVVNLPSRDNTTRADHHEACFLQRQSCGVGIVLDQDETIEVKRIFVARTGLLPIYPCLNVA
jgi:hypothetical protein